MTDLSEKLYGAGGRISRALLHEGACPLVGSPRTMGEFFPHAPLFYSDRQKIKKIGKRADLLLFMIGAGGRNRTDMESPPADFESAASTSFTTPARNKTYTNAVSLSSKKACIFPHGFV
jgi:hypothetical protein